MYTTITGSNANNFMNFVGITGTFNQLLVNPYTGFTIAINETLNVNNDIYDGRGGNDTLNMTSLGDVLQLVDTDGTIMIHSVEVFNAADGGDIINLAFSSVSYGNVLIRGAEGDDVLWGNDGHDNILGGGGNDNLIGGGGNDYLYGGDGNDYLAGAVGADMLAGGTGDDQLAYSSDDIWSSGLTLSDLGSSFFLSDMINVGGKNRTYDSFHGDLNDNNTITVTGYDTLTLTEGNDVLILTDSYSPQHGPIGARVSYIDLINAGGGDDVVDLSNGTYTNDLTIDGGTGHDVLIGSSQDDDIYGGEGNDHLHGGLGDDHLSGGAGDDVYYYGIGDCNETITETSGHDSIRFDAGIAMADIQLTVTDQNLHLHIGDAVLTIENHYAEHGSGRVETLVFADGSTFDLGAYIPNAAPDAVDDTVTGYRDTPITGSVLTNDSDSDNDALSVQAQTLTTINGGKVEMLADGTFTYTPAKGFVGADSFDYTALDGRGGEDVATVTLEVSYRLGDIVGTKDGETLTGGDGDSVVFGLGGDDILYGDDGYLGGVIMDKSFADTNLSELKERVNISKLNPSAVPSLGIADGNLTVDFATTATITFRKGYAGHNNSFGSFGIAEDGTIVSASLLWNNVKTAGINNGHTIDLPVGEAGGSFGFFIISNGDNTNSGYKNLDVGDVGNIHFVYNYGKADARDAKITDNGKNISVVYDDGAITKVLKGHTYFTTDRGDDASLNSDGKTHVVSGLNSGNTDSLRIGFEDLHNTGDADYEDVLFDLNVNPVDLGDINGGNDILDGGAGNDLLYGEGGDDILIMGDGLDRAFGGMGADIFAITTIDSLADRIEDFNAGEGDTINIADVLEGYDPLSGDIADYIQLVQNGADTQIHINHDGDAGGDFTLAALIVGNTDIDLASIIADQSALA